eukprot:COSAG03_NODE_2734_length_2490_cov_1739.109996_1_plen_131_part_10
MTPPCTASLSSRLCCRAGEMSAPAQRRSALMAVLVSSVAVLAQAGKYVTVVESHPQPVIGRELAASFGVLGGFETGNIIKEDGAYHMFYGEKANPTTYPWKMGWTTGVGHWVSPAATGPWTRLETVLSLSL